MESTPALTVCPKEAPTKLPYSTEPAEDYSHGISSQGPEKVHGTWYLDGTWTVFI